MDRLRELCPDVGLSNDLIVGFPTETEEDFEQTLGLLDRVKFDNIYAFAYSSRPGTRASKLPDDVNKKTKSERLNRLLKYQMEISEKLYASRVGKVMEILVEGESRNQKMTQDLSPKDPLKNVPNSASGFRVWTGRTACNRVVNFMSNSPRSFIGKWVDVKITASTSLSLKGEMVSDVNEGKLL